MTPGQRGLGAEAKVLTPDTNGTLGWRNLTRVLVPTKNGGVADISDGSPVFTAPDR